MTIKRGACLNSNEQIKKFLSTLAMSFPGEVPQARLNVYLEVLGEELKPQNLRELLLKLIEENEFFPTVKRILECIKPKEEPRALATEFVDTMIAILQGPGNAYEQAGAANYNFWIKTVGITRFDLANLGDVKFHRSSWIDRVERVYKGENILKFEKKSVAELLASAPNKGGSNEGA